MIVNSRRRRARSEAINQAADRLEAELRRLGAWSDTPLPPEKMQFTRAFGGDTMGFEQWIQFVLVARLRDIAVSGGPMPPSSNLSAYAVREFDGRDDEMAKLIELLGDVDDLCPPRRDPARFSPAARPPLGLTLLVLVGCLGWAAVALYATSKITGWIAAEQPVRVLAYAHFLGDADARWRGLTIQAWAREIGDSLRGQDANLALPARPRADGSTPLALSIDVKLDAPPPTIQLPDGARRPLSTAEIQRWAYGDAGQSAPAAADPVPAALFEILEGLANGAAAKAVESRMMQIGRAIGDSSVHPEIRRYPESVSTGLFVGIFSAIFAPPMLVWMVRQYRRNLAPQSMI